MTALGSVAKFLWLIGGSAIYAILWIAFQILKALARLLASLITGLIVGLLAMVYLNTGAAAKPKVADVIAYMLGERHPAPTPEVKRAALKAKVRTTGARRARTMRAFTKV